MLGLLAYRIWTIECDVAPIRASKSTLMPVLRVLVDAALLYSATLFTALLCFVNANNGQYVVLDLVNDACPVHVNLGASRLTFAISPADYAHHLYCILHGAGTSRHEAKEPGWLNHTVGGDRVPGSDALWAASITSTNITVFEERYNPTIPP